MGQYYKLANIDKREYVHPHELGDGLKLREQVGSGPFGIADAALVLQACSGGDGGGDYHAAPKTRKVALIEAVVGRWAGDRVVLIGDYAEPDDLPQEDNADLVYALCTDHQDYEDNIKWHWEQARRALEAEDYDRAKRAEDTARRMEAEIHYQNISGMVRVFFASLEDVKFEGEGWLKRTPPGYDGERAARMLPDLIITTTPGIGG